MDSIFKNKRVFLTGHTGFKGAWLLQILHLLGANVKGYALPPENDKDLYNQLDGESLCYSSVMGDVLDSHLLRGELIRFEPDFVFHLAAQSLVRRSYERPVDTFAINILGSINILEALRGLEKKCEVLMITTDKVYENNESGNAFRESDHLGGHDPYSASKAASEIVISSYRNSFFPAEKYSNHQKSIVTVRSGNVIGGGDYSEDRIIPDIVRSIERDDIVKLRNPHAIRPWQHVLDPLFAYLSIAGKMAENPSSVSNCYNVGPDNDDVLDVESVAKKFIEHFGKGNYTIVQPHATLHEAQTLLLDNERIKKDLGWRPLYNVNEAVRLTAEWYADKEQTTTEKTESQINAYISRRSDVMTVL